MSIFKRIKSIFLANASSVADHMDDPKTSLNYSLMQLEESQNKIHHNLVEVTAARERLLHQYDQLEAAADKYQAQAKAAADLGRDDLARIAVERKLAAQSRAVELESNIANLNQQLESLKENKVDLERKVSLFRSKKEELGAIYDASKAQVQFKEAVAGISKDLNDIGKTIQRTEARIEEMRSRSDAIDRLIADGVLVDALEPGKDNVDRELIRIHHHRLVEEELARLKAPSITEEQRKQLPANENDPAEEPPTD